MIFLLIYPILEIKQFIATLRRGRVTLSVIQNPPPGCLKLIDTHRLGTGTPLGPHHEMDNRVDGRDWHAEPVGGRPNT